MDDHCLVGYAAFDLRNNQIEHTGSVWYPYIWIMHALVLESLGAPLTYRVWPDPVPGEGDALVTLSAAALNRRDLWIQEGKYPGIAYPVVPGSDGCGMSGGERVVINPGVHWGDDERYQGDRFRVLGMPDQGTFAAQIAVSADHMCPAPAHLSDIECAALPLAGLTAYRALFTRGQARSGERVLVTGAGGGVAVTALQFAIAAGMEVYTTSSSESKIQKAQSLGVRQGVLYTSESWVNALLEMTAGFDLIIDSAGGDGFSELLKLLRPGGRIVTYGGTRGKVNGLSPQLIFWRQVTIMGSTMGSQKDFAEMLAFVNTHAIHPVVDRVFDIQDGSAAVEYLRNGDQFGKVVMRIAP